MSVGWRLFAQFGRIHHYHHRHPCLAQTFSKPIRNFQQSARNMDVDGSRTTEKRSGGSQSPEPSQKRQRLDTSANPDPSAQSPPSSPKGSDGRGNKKQGASKRRGGGGRCGRKEGTPAPELRDESGQLIPKPPRYPKRQCALLIGFCGSGYSGMQMQVSACV